MESKSIYYYTSNKVLVNWLKNEKIWATRSVTSNDSEDTTYIITCFDLIKEKCVEEEKQLLQTIKEILLISKYVCLREYKDILLDFLVNRFNTFYNISNKAYTQYKNSAYDENLFDKVTPEELDNMARRKNEKMPFNGSNILLKELLLYLKEEGKSNNIELFNYSRDTLLELLNLNYPFVICFSCKGDERFLWDSYTNNEGVCIEFSRKELKSFLNRRYPRRDPVRADLNDIDYTTKRLEATIHRVLKDAKKDGELDSCKIQIITNAAARCKNPFWRPEKECRAVIPAKYFNDSDFKIKENYNLKYNNGYKTQDYIEVCIPKKYAKKIILGPLNSLEKIKQTMKEEKYTNEEINSKISKTNAKKSNSSKLRADIDIDSIRTYHSSGTQVIRK